MTGGDGRRRPTATSNFGVGKRESHDATGFYRRFTAPEVSEDDTVLPPRPVTDPFRVGDARDMADLPDDSVALVVTSPPYFAGKQYEEELARDGVPASYAEYLAMLTGVFRECRRVLEPGGRIAVNVANLGRKPYRSLSADVIGILQEELGLLLRGEVVWQKAQGAGGNCAWGSFGQAANPTLRDLTERVVIASKGRFDRARTAAQRRRDGLPHHSTVTADEYMAATLDVWQIPPESARRVSHPAPFPVELPERLILLYTYEDDLVLDPFLGSGSALVAAARHGRRYVGYDLDPGYCAIAARRVADELATLGRRSPSPAAGPPAVTGAGADTGPEVDAGMTAPPGMEPLDAGTQAAAGDPAGGAGAGSGARAGTSAHGRRAGRRGSALARREALDERHADFQRQAAADGRSTPRMAKALLDEAGFRLVKPKRRLAPLGVDVSYLMADGGDHPWLIDVVGSFTSVGGGLGRPEVLWREIGKAHVLANGRPRLGELAGAPFLVVTSHLPVPGGDADRALRAVSPEAVFDVVELLDPVAVERLRLYAKGGHHDRPAPGFWPTT